MPDPDDHRCGVYALGHAASTGDRKVLCVTENPFSKDQFCKVITLGAATGGSGWREAASPPASVATWGMAVAVVKGVAYFMASGDVVAFDLLEEQWRPDLLQGPPSTKAYGANEMVELKDFLVTVFDDEDSIELWFLVDPHKAVRCKRYTIFMPSHGYSESAVWERDHDNPLAEVRASPVRVLDDGKIVICTGRPAYRSDGYLDNYRCTRWLRMYDPTTNTYTDGPEMENCVPESLSAYGGSLLNLPSTRFSFDIASQ